MITFKLKKDITHNKVSKNKYDIKNIIEIYDNDKLWNMLELKLINNKLKLYSENKLIGEFESNDEYTAVEMLVLEYGWLFYDSEITIKISNLLNEKII